MIRNPKKRAGTTEVDDLTVKKPKIDAIYLEDNTPVRTIKVENLLENTTAEYLRGYFENASGPIENVKIVLESVNECEQMVAFVTFKIPEDAAKLISDKSSFYKLTIKEAPDIYQPKLDPNALKLEQLNDDCLFHIISHLDLVDIVSLGETCVRMKSVIEPTCNKFRQFSFDVNTGDSQINELTLPTILKGIGPFIRSIEVHNLNSNTLEAFSEHCAKIIGIKMINPARTLSSTSFKKNKKLFQMLKSLEIKNSSFFDTSLQVICYAKKLKSLTLDECRNVRGTFLSRLAKLKKLKAFRCATLKNAYLYTCQKKNRLTKFATDLCGCTYVHFFQLPHTDMEHYNDIEDLQLDFSEFNGNLSELSQLSSLRNLKKLTVTRKTSRMTPFPNLNKFLLILTEISTLESLNIEYIQIEHDTVQHLSQITNLKHLRLSIINNQIDRTFYTTFHEHLPSLMQLTLQLQDVNQYNYGPISKMITALPNLKFFYHSSTTLALLKIIEEELRRAGRLSSIKIGISPLIDDPEMEKFIVSSSAIIVKQP